MKERKKERERKNEINKHTKWRKERWNKEVSNASLIKLLEWTCQSTKKTIFWIVCYQELIQQIVKSLGF